MNELFGYGIFSFIYSTSVKIINQSDLVIVGAFLSVASVREYSIGATLIYYTTPFITLISRTFFPSVQRKVSSGNMDDVKYLFYRQLRVSFCFGLLVYIGFVFYSEPFVKLWMHQDGFDLNSVKVSAAVMSVLALSKLPSLYLAPCGTVLAAMGFMRFSAIRSIIEAFVNVGFSLLFVLYFKFGLVGVAAGTLVARILVATISVPALLFYKTSFSIKEFIIKLIIPAVVAGCLFSLVCFLMVNNYKIDTWFDFILNIGILLLVWSVIAITIILPRSFRTELINKYSFGGINK
jgi:O-antigen/teichoic acid export membrane protein